MSYPIRLAVQIHPQQGSYAAMRHAAVEAEQRGADVVFNWDHFYPLYDDPDGAHFECWTQLASFAEVTSRVELGALVTCNSYRNPNLLADMARTVDHISGGRAILGIGSGWFERDYAEYGYEFGTAANRLRALRRDLPIIKSRLARLNPPPLRDMPILVGGGGEKVTLRITAEHADIWHGFGDAATIAHKRSVLAGHCRVVGRDPAEIEISAGIPREGRHEVARGDALVDAGATLLTFGIGGPDFDLAFLGSWVEWRNEKNQG
ncbi:MAG: LLM class F420-dependent oxidoreductase [Actinobacteria bacterium RBG_16_68_21]|nr:MAG: LLM class F420-dependent oxidoreductase [Actinobacteria bacterium RBG_16_68_21]